MTTRVWQEILVVFSRRNRKKLHFAQFLQQLSRLIGCRNEINPACCWHNQCPFDAQYRLNSPIENRNEREKYNKNLAGVKCRKCLGASWRRRNGSRLYRATTLTFSRILTCSCALVEIRAYKKKTDRVQDHQNTKEAVKMSLVKKRRKIKTSVVASLLNIERRQEPYNGTLENLDTFQSRQTYPVIPERYLFIGHK